MRKFIIVVVVMHLSSFLFAQDDYMRDLYKQRADSNILLLAKHKSIKDYVKISDLGIEMFPHPAAASPEFTLYWYEAADFLKKFQRYSYDEMRDYYQRKGRQRLNLTYAQRVTDFVRFTPDQIENLSVAIDPGHFAGNWKEAVQERKYVKVKASDAGTKEDIEIYEAQLNYATALLIKDTLESLNVGRVMITRQAGTSAVGKPFDIWFKEDFVKDTKALIANDEISSAFGNKLIAENKPYPAFKYVYSYIDFVNRSRAINEFKPDITLIQHYNADEYGSRQENGYWPLSDINYSMIFVPGSFMYGELRKMDARIDFLRLLISPDLEESVRLSKYVIKELDKSLGVPPITDSYESDMIADNCLSVGSDGIYSRNLYLTRSIESPVLYIETLFQDNKDEILKLNDKSVSIEGLKSSYRVKEVAHAYVVSLLDWLEENKAKNNTWSYN